MSFQKGESNAMATETGELEPISERLHSSEAGMLDSFKGDIIVEAPMKETVLQYVTTACEKNDNEGRLMSNGNKDDAAEKCIQKDASTVNVKDAESITDDQVTKFDMIEVSESQVREKGDDAQGRTEVQKLEEVHEDEHDEKEAKTRRYSEEKVNDIDGKESRIKSLEISTDESPLDAITVEMDAEKLERLNEDKHVQMKAETGTLYDENSIEKISVAEPAKPSEHAGNETEEEKLEIPLDAVPKDSELLKLERLTEDEHVEIEAKTGDFSDERFNKDINSTHVSEPAEEESTQESLQIYTKENLEPAEDEPGGGKLASPLDAIPDEAKADNLQRVTEEKHDEEEAITNEPLEIEDKEKLEPAEDCKHGTTIYIIPEESEENLKEVNKDVQVNYERVNEDDRVKKEEETRILNNESFVEIVSVPETSQKENKQPFEITTGGDAELAGDEPEGETIETSIQPILKEPEAQTLARVEDNKPVIQIGLSNDEISNEVDNLSLAQPAEKENTQDAFKTITEEDPEPAINKPEDGKLESPLAAVLKEPEAEKFGVEEDKHVAETESFNDIRGNDTDSTPFVEEENTQQQSLSRMIGEDHEPAEEEPEGGKLESSLDEFPTETEAEKPERTYEDKHVEIETGTRSFSDERAKDIDTIYITEPSEKLNTHEPLEIVTKEDLEPVEDAIKVENHLDAVLKEPEATALPSMLPHNFSNSGGVTSQHEIETISNERQVEEELVLEEITSGTNPENPNSESDKKDDEVKNDDNQNDLAGEESLNSACEDQVNNDATIRKNDIKDNHFNEMTSMELELASESIQEEKSEEARIETKDEKIENSTNDENNSKKSMKINELSMEDEAAKKVEDSNEIDAIKETTEEASDMHENTINTDSEEINQKASSKNTGTNEVRDDIEISTEENKSSNEYDMAEGTANNVSEMDKDSTTSASELSQTIDKDAVLQETQNNSDKNSPPVSQEQEHSHDPIFYPESSNEHIDTFREIDTKDKAVEDLYTSQASEKDNIWEATETKVDIDLMVEKDIYEKTEEMRSIEGEVTPEISYLEEQMETEDFNKNNDLEVEEGKEYSIAAVDGERSLAETEGDKIDNGVKEKEICDDKVQTPSKVVIDEIIERDDSQEVEKMDSFEAKEECSANKDNQEVVEKGTQDISYRADDTQAEISELVGPNDDKENEIREANIIDVYEKETKAENFKIITESLSEDQCQKEKNEFNPTEIDNSTNDGNKNSTMPRVDDLNEDAETINKNGEANQITEKGDSSGSPAPDVQSLSYMIPKTVSATHVVSVEGAYDGVDEKHENVINKRVIVEEETENLDINYALIENIPNPDKDENLSNIRAVNNKDEISGLSLEENGVENNYELESQVKLEQNDNLEINDDEVQIKEENVHNILEDTSRTANINSVELSIEGQIDGKEATNKNAESETIVYKEEREFENATLEAAKGDQNEERCDDNPMNRTAVEELINEFETANKENILSNEENLTKDTANKGGEMYEDAMNSTGGLNQTIINPIQQDTEADSEEASQPISKEQEQICDSIVDSEASSAGIDTFGGVKTTNKAIEDLSTSQASNKENIREETELEVAKEHIYTETNEDEIQDRSIVEDTKFMVENYIHETTGELRSIEGEVTPETISLDEQKVIDNLDKNSDLEVEQGKELSEVEADGERSLEETEVDKTIEGVEKENWQDKVEDPSKVVGMDTEVLRSRADDKHAELINEFEKTNEENLDKDTAIEEVEMGEDATNYTNKLSQTINKDSIQHEKEADSEKASQPISQEQEPKCDSIVDSEAASAIIDTVSEVNATNKAIEDLSTSQASKEENIREATELNVAKEKISTEIHEGEVQAKSMVEAPECTGNIDMHEKTGELRSIDGEVTAGTSSLDDQKVTENLNKNNKLELEQGKESYEVAVDGERSLEDTEGDKTILGVMEKEIWQDKVENPSKVVDQEVIKTNDSQEVEQGGPFEGKEECFTHKDEVGVMLDQAVVGMDTEVLASRADDEHAENIETNELRNESETENKENQNSNEDGMDKGTTIEGGEINEATNSTRELSQIIDKDLIPKKTETNTEKTSQTISQDQEHNDSTVDSEANTMEITLEEALENDVICESTDLILAKEKFSEIDSDKASQPIPPEQEHDDSIVDLQANTMEKATEEPLENDIICEATNPKFAKEQISTESNEEEIHNRGTGEHTEIMVAKDIHESNEGETTQEMSSLEEQNLTENFEKNVELEVEEGKETLVAAASGERSLEETPSDKTIVIVQQQETWDDKIDTPTTVVEEEIIEINDSQQVGQRDTFQDKEVCLANAEISEMVGPDDDKEKEKCAANLNNNFDRSHSRQEMLQESQAGEVGETTKVNDEANQSTESTDTEAYKAECEQNYQANVKGYVEGDDHKEKGDAEEFGIIKESVPKEHNQEDICESEVTDITIHNDNLDKVIPEIVGYACNLTTEEAKEAEKKEIYNDGTNETTVAEVAEVKEPDVTVETSVSEDESQVIKADAYDHEAYEEKGESKENINARLLLEKSANNEDEKMNEILEDLAVTNETAHGNLQRDQGQKTSKEDFSTRDGNSNEENDNTVTRNTRSAVEESKNNRSKIISDDNSQVIFAFNEETKQEQNIHEKGADSSNEEKDHEELMEVVVCENDKISEEAKSNGGVAFTSSFTSQEIEGDELHKTNEITTEKKLEILELNSNEGEEILNKDMSSTILSVAETEHLSLQSITKEEAIQAVDIIDEEAKDDELISQMNIETRDEILLQKEELGNKPQGSENEIEIEQKSDETSNEKKVIESESFEEKETTENSRDKSKMEDQEPEITPSVVLQHLERGTATKAIYEDETKKESTEIDKEENFQKDEKLMPAESVVESEQGNENNKTSCKSEVLEAEKSEQSDIITQIEKITTRSEALNIRLQEDISQEKATPIENIVKEIVSDEKINEVDESAVNTVPADEGEETKQKIGEKFSKISDYWPGGYKEETSNVKAMDIECSNEILAEAERSTCEIDVKGEEVLYVAKASEVDCKGGEEKLDQKVSSSVEPIEEKKSSQVVTGKEVNEKATHENDDDHLPVSQFLMKHILQEQADNLGINDEKYEDIINKLNEENNEDEVNNLKKEEVQVIKDTTIPEDEVVSEKFENISESVQEDQNSDVKEKSDIPIVKDDASILSEVSPHSFTDARMKLQSTKQSIQGSKVDTDEYTDPNVVEDDKDQVMAVEEKINEKEIQNDTDPNEVEDDKNQVMAVEEKINEKEIQNDIETQDKYVDISQKEGGEESKEFQQDIEKVELERQSTMDDYKIGEILEIESEVTKEGSGEDKEEGGEHSKEFHQDIKKVESEKQSTMDDCKIGQILETESGVTKEESGEEKQDVENKGQGDVKEELQLPETQNTDELQIKKEGEEECEPDHSVQNAEITGQTSEVEPAQKYDPSSNSSESSAIKDLESEEQREDIIHGNQQQTKNVTSDNVKKDKTDDEKDEKEDEDTKMPEESCTEATMMVEPKEVELKPTHKKSHNILSGVGSKVKHSITKVKKAITGKSSHTKTLSAK